MLDSEERTPLLVAVLRSSWAAARTLLKLGAEADIPDLGGRNLLHFLVMNSGRVDDLISACSVRPDHKHTRSGYCVLLQVGVITQGSVVSV